jgi:hypothetical protein
VWVDFFGSRFFKDAFSMFFHWAKKHNGSLKLLNVPLLITLAASQVKTGGSYIYRKANKNP